MPAISNTRLMRRNPAVPGALEEGLPTAKFSHVIRSTLPAETLWRLLLAGVQDSATAPAWPKRLVTLRLLSGELRVGAVIEASYNFFGARAPVHYDVLRFDPDARLLRYWACADHPLWGGGTVEVQPLRQGSVLRWDGGYQTHSPGGALLLAWFKLGFEPLFFSGLREELGGAPESSDGRRWRIA